MQYQSSAIHVNPDDPRFLGGEIITQEEAVEVEEMIEAQIEEGSAWAIKSAKAR